MRNRLAAIIFSLTAAAGTTPGFAQANQAAAKPNILVIFGDDIGIANVSAYSDGLRISIGERLYIPFSDL